GVQRVARPAQDADRGASNRMAAANPAAMVAVKRTAQAASGAVSAPAARRWATSSAAITSKPHKPSAAPRAVLRPASANRGRTNGGPAAKAGIAAFPLLPTP